MLILSSKSLEEAIKIFTEVRRPEGLRSSCYIGPMVQGSVVNW